MNNAVADGGVNAIAVLMGAILGMIMAGVNLVVLGIALASAVNLSMIIMGVTVAIGGMVAIAV